MTFWGNNMTFGPCCHWWWDMGLPVWPRGETSECTVEDHKYSMPKEILPVKVQSEDNAYSFSWYQGNCPLRICTSWAECQSGLLLGSPQKTLWKSQVKTSSTVCCKVLDPSCWKSAWTQGTVCSRVFAERTNYRARTYSLLARTCPMWFFSVSID
jgi:hypothetical protein